MIVAIHQPNFLPWLGYFYKMARADRFVLLDSAGFSKGGYTNRVQIKTPQGPQWLTVPVLSTGRLGQPIREVVREPRADFARKMAGTLEANYRRCPHYAAHAPRLCEIAASGGEKLAEMNIALLEYVAGELGIRTPLCRSGELAALGDSTELLINICRELGADTYLSGSGGAKYQEEAAFAEAGIKLIYANYAHPVYPQAHGPFVPGLSVVDLLLNCGPDSGGVLMGAAPRAEESGPAAGESRP